MYSKFVCIVKLIIYYVYTISKLIYLFSPIDSTIYSKSGCKHQVIQQFCYTSVRNRIQCKFSSRFRSKVEMTVLGDFELC